MASGDADTNGDDSNGIYFFKEGLRFVKPYRHVFECYAKRRWLNENLLKVYAKEFKAFSESYYEDAITGKNPKVRGVIRVNGERVGVDYAIQDNDRICHETYREETPITDEMPYVIMETDTYLIVNKPSSMPVHACGNFKYNTLQCILETQFGYRNKKVVHDEGGLKKKKKKNGKQDEVPEQVEEGLKGAIRTVHRLDRQTSGIVFFAKTEQASNRFR